MQVEKNFLSAFTEPSNLTPEMRDAIPPMQVVWLPIEEVKPYFRNARKNEKTVKAVKLSISEFGVQRAVIVDRDYVLVVGHAQTKAMRELGWKAIPVMFAKRPDWTWLTDAQCRAFRVKDNRDHELTQWDGDQLYEELSDPILADAGYDADFLGFEIKKVDEPAKKETWDYDELQDHFVVTIRAPTNMQPEILKRLADLKGVDIQVSQMKQPRKK
jgi:hypothetical protein